MVGNVTVRPFAASDSSHIVRLITGILSSEFPKDQNAYTTEDLHRLDETYSGPSNVFLVAEEGGHLVGTCGVKAEDSHTAILRRLFVDRSRRGSGVGTRLLKEAIDFCKKAGFREVMIRTSDQMTGAIRLCRSLGFQEEGRWGMGGVSLIRFCLRIP